LETKEGGWFAEGFLAALAVEFLLLDKDRGIIRADKGTGVRR